MNGARLKQIVDRHRLTFAIAGIVAVALLMTVISMSLYITSGTSSLDLSRPDYVQVREQLNTSKGVTFSESGPLNESVVKDFETLLESQQKSLDGLDGFSTPVLDDGSLQLQ